MSDAIQGLAQKIRDWEMDAGESFTDYFMEGRVNESNWAFWLLGKGFTQKANWLINEIAKKSYIDQVEKFHIHYSDEISWSDWDSADAIYFKDFLLWAEFFLGSDIYTARINEWFKEQEADLEEDV